jgi:hypothetical protein
MKEGKRDGNVPVSGVAHGAYAPGFGPPLSSDVVNAVTEELDKIKREAKKDREETVPAPR